MKKQIEVNVNEPLILATTNIVYSSRTRWCASQCVPLKLTLLRERNYFTYDKVNWSLKPLIVFLCGGGWTETDENIWIPELAWYAKQGFSVASVEYPVSAVTRYPDQLIAVSEAIKYLRDNSGIFGIDTSHIALIGESAGAYLAAMYAALNGRVLHDQSDLEYKIDCAIAFYPPNNPSGGMVGKADYVTPDRKLPIDLFNYPKITDNVDHNSVPLMIIHGIEDALVPVTEGLDIYEKWIEAGIDADIILIEGAHHGDVRCIQQEIKQSVVDFIRKHRC